MRQLATFLRTLVFVSALVAQGCKPPASTTKAESAASAGMFMPRLDQDFAFNVKQSSAITSPEVLATKLGIAIPKGTSDIYRVSTMATGENVLLVESKGMFPAPVASLGADGTKYKWWFQANKLANGTAVPMGTYLRQKMSDPAPSSIGGSGTNPNVYMQRSPYNSDGLPEPMLVPASSHTLTPSGQVIYRVGNTIINASGNLPVIEFRLIGNQVWELAGYYADADVVPGAVFWSSDMKTFYSLSPGKNTVVQWTKRDNNSMARSGSFPMTAIQVPDVVQKAVAARAKAGFGTNNRPMAIVGINQSQPDAACLPLYQTSSMLQTAVTTSTTPSTGLALAASTPKATPAANSFYQFAWEKQLQARGITVSNAPAKAPVALGITQNQVGTNVQVLNQNNGAYWPNCSVVSSDTFLIPRGTLNQMWTGSSDYTGVKETYEILDNNGNSTGQFIQNTYYPAMGMFGSEYSEQTYLSRSQIASQTSAQIASSDDQMRQNNAQIAATGQQAAALGQSADFYANAANTQFNNLPGNIAADATAAAFTPPGLSQAQTAGVGMLKTSASQIINTGDISNPTAVVASGLGSYCSTISGGDLPGMIGSQAANQIGSNGFTDMVNGTGATQDGVILSTANGASSVAWQTVGTAFGPAGKAAAAVGNDFTQVGIAETGSLVQSGRQLSSLNEQNADISNGINIINNTKDSQTIQSYLSATQSNYDKTSLGLPADAQLQGTGPDGDVYVSGDTAYTVQNGRITGSQPAGENFAGEGSPTQDDTPAAGASADAAAGAQASQPVTPATPTSYMGGTVTPDGNGGYVGTTVNGYTPTLVPVPGQPGYYTDPNDSTTSNPSGPTIYSADANGYVTPAGSSNSVFGQPSLPAQPAPAPAPVPDPDPDPDD